MENAMFIHGYEIFLSGLPSAFSPLPCLLNNAMFYTDYLKTCSQIVTI